MKTILSFYLDTKPLKEVDKKYLLRKFRKLGLQEKEPKEWDAILKEDVE